MYRLWRLALTLLTLKIQSGVMADFVVTVNTNSITVTWDDPTISGLSVFTISLDDDLKFSGDDTAKPPVTINGLLSGTTHHLVIKTTTHGSTTSTIVVDEHKTTPMGDADVSGEHNGKVYKVYKERKNYNDAKAACEATDDGRLVTVDGEGVQRALNTLMERSIVTKAWLGAKRTKTDWRWVGSGKSLKYQGCFSDTGDARLSVSVSSKQDNTPDSCIAECRHRNNKYAGVKRDSNDGRKVVCRCGDYFKRDSHVNDCNDDCPTDGRQKCGKPNRMRIYAVDNTPENLCLGNYGAGKCYTIHSASSTGLSWYEARWECADNGGELLQVETKAFFYYLKSVLPTWRTWWIGSSRIRWQWPNGNELLYTNWASDSPNSETSACVVIDSGSKWKDMSCFRPNGFICETGKTS
ncbi:hypothetical protein LSAT2_018363 [Lamellibrachia satsuma]|nr:hypothetical protein LSAT2_018363 [Lamellibrachia satsuma]